MIGFDWLLDQKKRGAVFDFGMLVGILAAASPFVLSNDCRSTRTGVVNALQCDQAGYTHQRLSLYRFCLPAMPFLLRQIRPTAFFLYPSLLV